MYPRMPTSILYRPIECSRSFYHLHVCVIRLAKPDNPNDAIPWVELKTAQQPATQKDDVKYERKLLKFWAQSFLLGVPKIVVGFRSPDGHLLKLMEHETQKIPSVVKRQGQGTWDGNTCINFAAAMLEFIKTTVQGDGVWRIQRRQKDGFIEAFKVDGVDAELIVPPSFRAHREHLMAKEVAAMLGSPVAKQPKESSV